MDNASSTTTRRVRVTRLILTVALTVLMLAFYIRTWNRVQPYGSDFAAFYSAALLWRQHQNPYDHSKACDIQNRAGIALCLPFFHPPVLLPLLSMVSNNDYEASYLYWCVILLIVTLLCLLCLFRLTDPIKALVSITFLPIFVSILQGQDTVFVLLGTLLCALFLRDGRDTLAGIALSLTVLRPHLGIALGIPLLFARPKVFRGFFFFGLVWVAYSFLLIGTQGFREIISAVVLTAQGTDPSTQQEKMYNLVGVCSRLGISPLWAWPFFVGGIVGISVLWRKRLTSTSFALGIVIALITSPHLHLHDLALLIVPLLTWPASAIPLISITFPLGLAPFLIYPIVFGLALSNWSLTSPAVHSEKEEQY